MRLWDGFPEEAVFELEPEGQVGVCLAEDRERCCWQRDGVQSGHVSSPECSEGWVWHMTLDPGACSISYIIIYPQHLQRVGGGGALGLGGVPILPSAV